MDLRKLVGSRPIIMVGACVVVIDKENKILLHLRKDNNCWGLAGGSLEMDESLVQMARRELFEETGLTLNKLELFNVYSGEDFYYKYPHGDEVYNVVTAYICNDYEGELKKDESEVQDQRVDPLRRNRTFLINLYYRGGLEEEALDRVLPSIYKGGITLVQKLFYILIALALISGCSNEGETTTVTIDSIDAEEVLTLNPDADIFQFDGVIYKTHIDWIEELSLTKDVQIGKIKAKNDTNTDFKDEMSNKLPVGAKIFSAKERGDILIVESEGGIKKYLAIVEG